MSSVILCSLWPAKWPKAMYCISTQLENNNQNADCCSTLHYWEYSSIKQGMWIIKSSLHQSGEARKDRKCVFRLNLIHIQGVFDKGTIVSLQSLFSTLESSSTMTPCALCTVNCTVSLFCSYSPIHTVLLYVLRVHTQSGVYCIQGYIFLNQLRSVGWALECYIFAWSPYTIIKTSTVSRLLKDWSVVFLHSV